MIVTDGLIEKNKNNTGKSDYQRWNGHHIDCTSKGKFKVRKSINGSTVYFGTYDTFSEAVDVRDLLIANDWDKSILETEKDRINEYYRYIKLNGNFYYEVNRPKNNKNNLPRYMGSVKTIEEALYYRDIAESLDYIIGKPSEYDLITDNPYIREGLLYPVPERLRLQVKKNTGYGKGYVKHKSPNSYQVWHNKDYYGSYTTPEYAEYIRLKLCENNWDKNQLDNIKKAYPEYYTYILHFWRAIYHTPSGTWKFFKRINGEEFSITFQNPYDALYERDLYEKYNGDMDLIVELANDEENPYVNMTLPPYPTRKSKKLIKYEYNEEYYKQIIEDMTFFIKEFNITTRAGMAETLNMTSANIGLILKRFNIKKWDDFKDLVDSGEEPLEVLNYNEKIVTPDLTPIKSKSNHVYYDKNRKYSPWIIQKDNIRYGSYSTKKIAKKVVTRLKKVGWDKKQLPCIIDEIGYIPPSRKGETSKIIYEDTRNPKKTRYYIRKKGVWYGSYNNRKAAETAVRLLEKCDWDKKQLPTIKEKIRGIV